MNQESIWSARYRDAGDDYLFGTEPNRFLAHRLDLLQSGRTALSVADGEGRNSVWLAEQGLEVTAIEISAIAVQKARHLAAGRKLDVNFIQADMLAPAGHQKTCTTPSTGSSASSSSSSAPHGATNSSTS